MQAPAQANQLIMDGLNREPVFAVPSDPCSGVAKSGILETTMRILSSDNIKNVQKSGIFA